MKRLIALLVSLVLLLGMGAALADTYYVKSAVSLRDEQTNEVLVTVPADTALEPDGDRSTDLFAYVSYGGYSGFVLWNYLSRTAPGEAAAPDTRKDSVDATPAPALTPAPTAVPAPATQEPLKLRTVNAVIQRATSKNKATGASMSEMTVTAADNVIITADIPRGKKLDYWVFNGVRYDFLRAVSSFRMTAIDQSWTIEAVFKKTDSQTLRTPQAIQEARTGETLVCRTINSEFCHLKSGTSGGGGWISEFNFTSDYSNRATGAPEKGGQLTAKVRAVIPGGKRVVGWKFDKTEIYPKGATIKQFIVNTLDTSKTYEPIFNKAVKVTNPPAPDVKYVRVTCIKCKISGGPYSGQTSANVPVGTTITVRANENSSQVYWDVNGSSIGLHGRSITRKINSNTTIEAFPVIN